MWVPRCSIGIDRTGRIYLNGRHSSPQCRRWSVGRHGRNRGSWWRGWRRWRSIVRMLLGAVPLAVRRLPSTWSLGYITHLTFMVPRPGVCNRRQIWLRRRDDQLVPANGSHCEAGGCDNSTTVSGRACSWDPVDSATSMMGCRLRRTCGRARNSHPPYQLTPKAPGLGRGYAPAVPQRDRDAAGARTSTGEKAASK